MTRFRTGPVRPIIDNPLMKLVPTTPAPGTPGVTSNGIRLVWATVTDAYPDSVQIQIDTEDQPLAGTPAMLCQVSLGDRVMVAISNKQVTVLGVGQPDQSIGPDDTGWVTSGLTVTSSAIGWRVNSYNLRRVFTKVWARIQVQYTGTTQLKAGTDGNLGDIGGVVVLPAEWASNAYPYFGTMTKSGVLTWFTRLNTNGVTMDVTHGLPNSVINQNDYLYVDLEYFQD